MAGHIGEMGGIKQIMAGQMANPTFPVPLEAMRGNLHFEDFNAGDNFKLHDNISIKTVMLNHPAGATGYRVEFRGKAMCYVTDTEHIPGKPDENVLALIEGADLVVYDSTYTESEFPSKVGWGHSTWQEGVRLAKMGNAKMLAIFHHDPDHEDGFMELLEAEARAAWPGAIVARENMRINLL
jgi:phosphoribosyl 1,2-cyclic phosphodiesterase